jgi:hypothetical protein
MVNLAIIDTGLNKIRCGKSMVQVAYRIIDKTIVELPDFPGHEDHCDIIYKILERESGSMRIFPAEAHIHIINILDENLRSHFVLLDKAINYILERDIQLVHMSLSYVKQDMHDYFVNIVNKLQVQNCFVVCAATSYVSYPSVLKQVISVTDKQTGSIRPRQNRAFDFVVDVDAYNYDFISKSEPSYAAPFITAKAVDVLNTRSVCTVTELKKELSSYFKCLVM